MAIKPKMLYGLEY